MLEVQRDYLKKLVASAAEVVVLGFFVDWCRPCQDLGYELPKFVAHFPMVKFAKLDRDQNPGITSVFQVRAVRPIREEEGRQER
jgi:thioredoxin-like negative regulator of GroEL